MSDLVGKTLGKYQIVERIGRGGMAEVYKAFQPGLERYVAVKVLHGYLTDDPTFLGRFRREAQSVAALRHPNIVQVFDFDVQDDSAYMVMELLDGLTLKGLLDQRFRAGQTLELSEVLHIMEGVCAAVGYAHGQGMIHRDLKPANILLTNDGRVILTDFGVARIVGGQHFTASGAVTGTPAYMSPEQGQGGSGDERSDIYALGIVLYESVTGHVPYDGDTPVSILLKHITDPVPLLRHIHPELPESLEQVIQKALAKDPAQRYQTADTFITDLRIGFGIDRRTAQAPRLSSQLPARPDETVEKMTVLIPRPSKRLPVVPLRILALAALALTITAVLLIARPSGRPVTVAPTSGPYGQASPPALATGAGVPAPSSSPTTQLTPNPLSLALAGAAEKLKSGDYQQAYDAYNALVQSNPESVDARLGRAQASIGLDLFDDAQTDISEAARLAPTDPRPRLAQARFTLQFESDYDWNTLKAQLDAAVALDPALAESYYTRGWAVLYYQPATGIANNLFALGCLPDLQAALASGHAAAALVDLQRAIDLDASQPDYHLALSDALFGTNSPEMARAETDAALALAPDDLAALYRRAILNYTLADYAAAESDLTTIMSLPDLPGDASQWQAYRALVNYQRTRYADALGDVAASLQLSPANPTALYAQGLVYYWQGKLDDSLATLQQVAAHAPADYDCPFFNPRNDIEINADIGYVYFDKGDLAAAIQRYDETIRLYPDWYLGYYYRALAHAKGGQPQEALVDFQRALDRAPDEDSRNLVQVEIDKLLFPSPTPP